MSNSKNVGSNIYALPQSITIKGKGFGHGVGMCQVGTLQKARAGWNWQDIIQLYYPQVELSSDWLNLLSMDHQTSISD